MYNTYSKNDKVRELLSQIVSMKNIPIEILSKYYARLLSSFDFYKDITKELEYNGIDKYLPFISTLYQGIRTKSLPLCNDNILYGYQIMPNYEIEKIK